MSHALQVRSKLDPGPVDPGFHRADGSAHLARDVFISKSLLMKQCKDETILGSQPGHSGFKGLGELGSIGSGVGAMIGHEIGHARDLGSPAAAFQRGAAPVGDDPEQPGTQGTRSVKSMNGPDRSDERFLNHVLGILAVA